MSIKEMTTLAGFLSGKSQQKAAEPLGISQGAITKAAAAGRQIFITTDGKGNQAAYEVKRIFVDVPTSEGLEEFKTYINKHKFPT